MSHPGYLVQKYHRFPIVVNLIVETEERIQLIVRHRGIATRLRGKLDSKVLKLFLVVQLRPWFNALYF